MPPMHVEKQEYIIRNYISLLNTSPLAQRLPQLIIRDWRHYMNWKFRNRVNEISAAGMKADAAVTVRTVEAIFQIAFNRATHFCQLATDLMMTAGFKVDFQKIIIIRL